MKITPLPPPVEAGHVRIVLVGDVVGKPGLRMVIDAVPWIRQKAHADFIVVNAENAADGAGLRIREYERLIAAGVDGITLGDHIYRKREIFEVLDSRSNIVKPANFPPEAPGKTFAILQNESGVQLAIISLLGRVFMRPVDCPFHAIDRVLQEIPPEVKLKLVDMHAEATSDKQLMGRYLDGRVSAVLGTHTHVPTADETILPNKTGYQSDVGMTGPLESILGRKIEAVMATTLSFDPNAFHVATEDVWLSASWFDAEVSSGKCTGIGRIQWPESLTRQWQTEQSEFTKRL